MHDAVANQTIEQLAGTLDRGTVLVSATVDRPMLLVGVAEEVTDATGACVARRFGYAHVDETGTVTPAGPAPYLDCVPAPEGEAVDRARVLPWLGDAEEKAASWMVAHRLPEYLAEVRTRRELELKRTREQVTHRLSHEINRLAGESLVAGEKEAAGERPK